MQSLDAAVPATVSTNMRLTQEYRAWRKKNILKGIAWLTLPSIIFVLVILVFFFAHVTVGLEAVRTDSRISDQSVVYSQVVPVAKEIRIVAGFLVVSSLFFLFAGILLGLMYLSRDREIPGFQYDERSGSGPSSSIPPEIRQWNWGAAGLTWVWGSSHRIWWSLLAFIPGFSIFIMILLGLRGNEYAWRAKKYQNTEDFLEGEEAWKPWGILFFILHVLGILWLRF